MRKYFLIGFLILAFSLTSFAQDSSEVEIENIEEFVRAKILVSKTAIYVGDRFELKIEIVYPKGWGIEILTEDLEKGSMTIALPDSVVLEEATISQPIPWDEYFLKIEAVYTIFYPEKKHNIGILFNPQDLKPIKIRFKWVDEEDEELGKEIEIYEVETEQFVEGVRSTLTSTSNRPRDDKVFSGNFNLKSKLGWIIGIVFMLVGVYILIRKLYVFLKSRSAQKEVPIGRLLKEQYQKLQDVYKDSNQEGFNDSFCSVLRGIIGIKTGFKVKASSMTATEMRGGIPDDQKQLLFLVNIVEIFDEFRYNPKAEPPPKEEALQTVEDILSGWIRQEQWWWKVKARFEKVIRAVKRRKC